MSPYRDRYRDRDRDARKFQVRVIFVRHCESTWNEVFNKGTLATRLLLMPIRLVNALINEVLYSPSGGSVFLDSPLSDDGLVQARSLKAFVEGKTETDVKKQDDVEQSVRVIRGEVRLYIYIYIYIYMYMYIYMR